MCLAERKVRNICVEYLECVGGFRSVLPWPNLKILSIIDSTYKVKEITSIFKKMVSLEYLDMNGFSKNKKLNIWKLFLLNNTKLPKLIYLYMGNTSVTYICSRCLNRMSSLQQLYLDKNQIIALNSDINLLPNLKY